MISLAAMTDLETMLKAQAELRAEIDALASSAARIVPGLKRPRNAPELDAVKMKTLKLQLNALGMKIAGEQARLNKPTH
jgi:hypothetical protein